MLSVGRSTVLNFWRWIYTVRYTEHACYWQRSSTNCQKRTWTNLRACDYKTADSHADHHPACERYWWSLDVRVCQTRSPTTPDSVAYRYRNLHRSDGQIDSNIFATPNRSYSFLFGTVRASKDNYRLLVIDSKLSLRAIIANDFIFKN